MKRALFVFAGVFVLGLVIAMPLRQMNGTCPQCGGYTVDNPDNVRRAWCEKCGRGWPVVHGKVIREDVSTE